MRHIALALTGSVALLTFAADAAFALPVFSHQRAELFATCSGRMAALAAHQRSMRKDDAMDTQRLYEDFEVMLDATMPHALEDGVPITQPQLWRSRGWAEMAADLAEMHYAFDQDLSDLASRKVSVKLDACRDILLPRA